MAISCAHCGGQHATPADVRRCWADGTSPAPIGEPQPEPDEPMSTRDERGAAAAPGLPLTAAPGPDELGRNVVVAVGQDPPSPWQRAQRVRIDAAVLDDPAEVLATLRTAAAQRRRLVIEIDVERAAVLGDPDLDLDDRPVATRPPHELGARFHFERDELHHLVWSNSVDGRGAPRWSALERAIAAGWTPAGAEIGDVVGSDGQPYWIDGGPLRFTPPIGGVPVVHAVAVEHGGRLPPVDNETRAALAPDQRAAVTHDGGGARIVAPAGSGKTRVLTERARHLVTRWRLPAQAVTLVAFNKRAQLEMTDRLSDVPGLRVRTLNSLALAIIDGAPPFLAQPRRWTTIDEPEVRRLLGDLVSFPRRRNSDPVAPWIEALGLARLGLVDPSEVEARYDGEVDGFASVFPTYRDLLDRRGVVDFDEQIYRAVCLLLSEPRARAAAQRACRVMLVDEFQDLTPAHLLFVRLLAAPGAAVFGVGDDDQTIYGYNGADPAWLIDFGELFPGAGDHPLEVNYRCPAGVVEAADRLLRHNRRRVPKTIRASSEDTGGWRVAGGVDPVAESVAAVERHLGDGAEPSEIAVLTRVNASLAPVQVALCERGVPIAGGVGLEFLERTSVRAASSWLRLASVGAERGRFAPDDLREALRRPSRSFHPRVVDWIAEQDGIVDLHRLAGRLRNERDADRLAEFAADIGRLQQLVRDGAPTSDVVLALIDEVGLAGSVATLDATRRGMNRGAQGDDLTAVTHLAALHDDAPTFHRWLRDRLATRRDPDGVSLATVHRVKGQEWPRVVVHLAGHDQFPHRLAEDVEEERRLFHVAITRAARQVTIVTGPQPTPFAQELTSEPSESAPVVASRPPPVTSTSSPRADPTDGLDADARVRFDALRVLRNDLRDGKPAYVVFDNKTLAAIADQAPTTTRELARISGVGPAKLERYGDAVIELISGLLAGQ